ncbi:MAG: glycosyltransferase family 39 protein [Endomicrobia bacterium]|nr:glycosyltransferase family 39 protein [Endomicrobiia bacterium]
MKIKFNSVVILSFILFIALLYRLRGLFNPLTDYHSWRQTDTASVAYNFYVSNMNIFTPRLNVFPEIRELEFHIYPYIIAILYKIFGFYEFLGRLVSILFGIATTIFLYFIVKLIFDEEVALWSVAFFAVNPMAVYYNRTFMPESCMLFFTIAGIYYLLKWVREGGTTKYILSIVFISGAILTKATSAYILFVVVYLLYLYKKKELLSWWIYIPLVLILPFLWYYYSHLIFVRAGGAGSIWNIGTDKWFNKEILTNVNFYRRIWLQHLGELYFAYIGYLFFIVGFFSKMTKEQKFIRVWVVAIFIYFVVVAVGNYVHEYYQFPILLPGSILVGVGIKELMLKWQRYKVWLVILLLWFPIYGYTKSRQRMKFDVNYKIAAEALAEVSLAEDKIVVVSSGEPEVLYYAKRKGWHFDIDKIKQLNLEKYIKLGAKYLIILPKEKKVNLSYDNAVVSTFQPSELVEIDRLKEKFNVIKSSNSFFIFKLS